MCPNCGAYHYEQEGGRVEGMTLTCLACGYRWHLESYREDGEDKWRDRDDR
jgi:transposase-like protein